MSGQPETQKRADTVRDFLVSKGVDAGRLTPVGAGAGPSRVDFMIDTTAAKPAAAPAGGGRPPGAPPPAACGLRGPAAAPSPPPAAPPAAPPARPGRRAAAAGRKIVRGGPRR